MDRDQFLEQTKGIAKGAVRQGAKRLGKAGPFLDKDDLQQEAYLELLTLHKRGKVDFSKSRTIYVHIRVKGHIKNELKKEWGRREMAIPQSEFGSQEDGSSLDMEEIAFIHGTEPMEDEETNRVKDLLFVSLGEALETLTPEERFILKAYYVDGKSCKYIGRMLGYSREKVRRFAKKALAALRTFLEGRGWSEMDIGEMI